MLEQQKIVIRELASDRELFQMELKKTLSKMSEVEMCAFCQWARDEFSDRYPDVIEEAVIKRCCSGRLN
jgi:hypothetical protein